MTDHAALEAARRVRDDPFYIDGPALISFSGGRTSGYMLWRILQSHGGELPPDVRVTFANTGKEMPETLDFVRDCGERWGVNIAWLEWRREPPKWTLVTYETASRAGEPFDALIAEKQMLPNPVMRYCTQNLKIRTIERFARSLGFDDWTSIVGLRADEPRRVAKLRARNEAGKNKAEAYAPLALAMVTRRDVAAFWAAQNFDLRLQGVDGSTPDGNCNECFLKSAGTIMSIMRRRGADPWWRNHEINAAVRGTMRKPEMALFRADRPSYAAMADAVERQVDFDFGNADELNDCYCHE